MWQSPESLSDRCHEAVPAGRGMLRGRAGTLPIPIPSLLAVIAVALGGLLMSTPAMAQAPGPELFAQEPRTPLELWGAIDYLVRTGQSKKAVPYLDRFTQGQIDDGTLVEIRDKYGAGSIWRLADQPETSKYTQPLAEKLTAAVSRNSTQPERHCPGRQLLDRHAGGAILRHRPAQGSRSVRRALPGRGLQQPEITPEKRGLLARNLGRLDRTAVPALLAVLDSSDHRLAAEAATALGAIGDSRAVPFLTYLASAGKFPPALREAAQAAIGRLTGRSFVAQPRSPAQVLTEAAWSFHRHQVEFPSDPVAVWVWDKDRKVPVPRPMQRGEAEGYFGLRLANEAIELQPLDLDARTAMVSLSLEKGIDRVGFNSFPAQDQGTFAAAVKTGPAVLVQVLHKAIADGKDELAAVAAMALARVTDPGTLAVTGHPHPLAEALSAPGREFSSPPPRPWWNWRRGSHSLAPAESFPRLPTSRQPEVAPGRGY